MSLAGGAAATWPIRARAQQQQTAKLPMIGLLVSGTPATHGLWVNAFVQRLRELGWIEGRTLAIEYRWAEGNYARFAEIGAELVNLKPSIIVTNGNATSAPWNQIPSPSPSGFPVRGNPVGPALAPSRPRPGAN